MFQLGLNQHLFSKLSPLFVFSISVVKLINQSFDLCDRPEFKLNIYHRLKVSYSIRLVIIKHVFVKELLILQVQNDDIKCNNPTFQAQNNSKYFFSLYLTHMVPVIGEPDPSHHQNTIHIINISFKSESYINT